MFLFPAMVLEGLGWKKLPAETAVESSLGDAVCLLPVTF